MLTAAPLIITAEVRAALHILRDAAARDPIDMTELPRVLASNSGRRFHRRRMTRQTVMVPGPWPFFVTFSIETGHGAGTCRHMSMSVMRERRVPAPAAIWMIAEEMGFAGGLEACTAWPEELSDGGMAINIVQPLAVKADALVVMQ